MENRIAELRKERGLTLKQLGEVFNVRDSTLSQYETGKRNPQLGLLQELADYFGVSIEFLTRDTDERDFPVNTDSEALKVIKMMDDNKINILNLSKSTSLQLALWIMANSDKFTNGIYQKYLNTASSFIRTLESEVKVLKRYSEMRRNVNQTVEKIYEKLTLEEDYYGASPKEVLEFIEQSERVGYEEVDKILENMKKLPDAPEED